MLMELLRMTAARAWSLCVGVIVILALGPANALAQASEPKKDDVLISSTGVNVDADPATRVKQFEAYRYNLRGGIYKQKKAIITKALDEGTLSPAFSYNNDAIFFTCPDLSGFVGLGGRSVALKVALEPTFALCYKKPYAIITYDKKELRAFIDKLKLDFPNKAPAVGSTQYYFPDRYPSVDPSFDYDNQIWTYLFVQNDTKDLYYELSAPYAKAYYAKQARITAEQKQAVELAAKAKRLAKMENPAIVGLGLNTSREAFLAISSKGRNVWLCVPNTRVRTEICTARIRNEVCSTADTVAGDNTTCKFIPDPKGAASPALTKVSTILGQPVSEIVVSYFDNKIESIKFVMTTPPSNGSDRTDYYSALRQMFGEPENGYWEGKDSRLFLRKAITSVRMPVTFLLQRPSVVAAKEKHLKSL